MTTADINRGIFTQNPVFRFALGVCPALAVTATVADAAIMGMLVICVMAASNFAVSLTRNFVAQRVRIPCHILIVTAFASMADILLSAHAPQAAASLGIYVPLIAVNCLILNRTETFAAKNKPLSALFDGIVAGLGFTAAMLACSVVREVLGSFSLMGVKVVPGARPFVALTTACGAFFSFALVLGLYNYITLRRRKEKAP